MHDDMRNLLHKRRRQIGKQIDDLEAERDDITIQLEELDLYDSVFRDVYDYLMKIKPKRIVRLMQESMNLETDLNLSVAEYNGFIDLVHENYALKFKTMTSLRHPSRVNITIGEIVKTIVKDQQS